jgi:PLD-like domain
MTPAYGTLFLRDGDHGGDAAQAARVAHAVAEFAAAARTSLELAIYDLRLDDPGLAAAVVDALTGAAARGVTVRVAYDAGKPAGAGQAALTLLQADPAPAGTADWVQRHLAGTGVQVQPIHAAPQLMHDKYVVRDAPTAAGDPAPTAGVWTGSTNFTDDAWTRQDNNILTVASTDLARGYRTDFDEMWAIGTITDTGTGAGGTTTAGGATLGWDFPPATGRRSAPRSPRASPPPPTASRSPRWSSPPTSCSPRSPPPSPAASPSPGISDDGQMDPIERQWRANPMTARSSPTGRPSARTSPSSTPPPTPPPARTTSCT